MQIKDLLYRVVIEGNTTFFVVAKSFNDAVRIVYKWRNKANILSVETFSTIVLTDENTEHHD